MRFGTPNPCRLMVAQGTGSEYGTPWHPALVLYLPTHLILSRFFPQAGRAAGKDDIPGPVVDSV